MNEPPAEEVAADEPVARFIVYDRYVRQDRTVRPEAFIPYPYPDLSVTRHRGLSEGAIWKAGERVAQQTGRPLHGRADVVTMNFRRQRLVVVADPVPENPNHANVTGWPADKPTQKVVAQEIAAASRFWAAPPG